MGPSAHRSLINGCRGRKLEGQRGVWAIFSLMVLCKQTSSRPEESNKITQLQFVWTESVRDLLPTQFQWTESVRCEVENETQFLLHRPLYHHSRYTVSSSLHYLQTAVKLLPMSKESRLQLTKCLISFLLNADPQHRRALLVWCVKDTVLRCARGPVHTHSRVSF